MSFRQLGGLLDSINRSSVWPCGNVAGSLSAKEDGGRLTLYTIRCHVGIGSARKG